MDYPYLFRCDRCGQTGWCPTILQLETRLYMHLNHHLLRGQKAEVKAFRVEEISILQGEEENGTRKEAEGTTHQQVPEGAGEPRLRARGEEGPFTGV